MGAKKTSAMCIGLVALALSCVGCAANQFHAALKPPAGILLTSYTVPLSIPTESITTKGLKKSTVKSSYFCWPYPSIDLAWSDSDKVLGELAIQGRISKVEYADLEVFTCLGIFGTYTVNVYGPSAR